MAEYQMEDEAESLVLQEVEAQIEAGPSLDGAEVYTVRLQGRDATAVQEKLEKLRRAQGVQVLHVTPLSAQP